MSYEVVDINEEGYLVERKSNVDKNLMILALELASLKTQELNPDLSFFIDSFNNENNIDISSENYTLNSQDGFVWKKQSGPFYKTETTKTQFDNGTFSNIESFNDIGGDGALRKTKLISGSETILEDFETNDNVFYLKNETLNTQDFETGGTGSWTFINNSGQWNAGILASASWGYGQYVKGQYGIALKSNDYLESDIFNSTANVRIKFYCNTSNINSNDELLVGFYDGSSWHIIDTVSYNQDGYFDFAVPDSYAGSGNKVTFDISDTNTLFANDYNNWENIGVILDDIEVYQENELNLNLDTTNVYSGTYSGKFNVNFNNENNSFTIDLNNDNISSYKYIKLHMFKPFTGVYKYKITLIDSSEDTWDTGNLDFPDTFNWFTWEEEINNIIGIDKTNIDKVRIDFIEVINDTILWNETYEPSSTNIEQTLVSDYEVYQTFQVSEEMTVGRIEVSVKTRDYQPRNPLFIGLANIFGTTLSTATINGNLANSTSYGPFEDIIVNFNQNVTLYPNQTYKILLITEETNWDYAWDLKCTNTINYSNGTFYIDGNHQTEDLSFRLLNPKVNELIYFDELFIEAESTYESSGIFTSQKIDLKEVPDTLEDLYWTTKFETNDDIRVAVKFASTETGLNSASWSSWFINSSTNDLSSLTPNRWYQYKIEWLNGDSTGSTILKDITLEFDKTNIGNGIIISEEVETIEEPDEFVLRFEDNENSGSINYFVSRNNGTNWQFINRNNNGEFVNFDSSAGYGTTIKLKGELIGDAKLYGWSLSVNKEII